MLLKEWLDENNVQIYGSRAIHSFDRQSIEFTVECPWQAGHVMKEERKTFAFESKTGAFCFKCWDRHCHGRDWTMFKEKLNSTPRPMIGVKEIGDLDVFVWKGGWNTTEVAREAGFTWDAQEKYWRTTNPEVVEALSEYVMPGGKVAAKIKEHQAWRATQ